MEAVNFLRSLERRIIPQLSGRLDQGRLQHMRSVNNAFQRLVEGDFAAIYEALSPKIKAVTDYQAYCRTLAEVRRQYFSLTSKEKRNLAAAVALHDIGYLEDQGIWHGQKGARMVSHFLMLSDIRDVDRMAVSEMIEAHGLYADSTVQFLLADTKSYSEQRRVQILILNIVDIIGKNGRNYLSQRGLEILIGLKEGRYDDPRRYYELRLRSLLGPAAYSYIESDQVFKDMIDRVNKLPEEDREGLLRNLTARFRNACWPVFHDLVLKCGRPDEFLTILLRISRLADEVFKDKKEVVIAFEPDFFRLNEAEREPFLQALKNDPRGDYLFTIDAADSGIIVVNLRNLLPRA